MIVIGETGHEILHECIHDTRYMPQVLWVEGLYETDIAAFSPYEEQGIGGRPSRVSWQESHGQMSETIRIVECGFPGRPFREQGGSWL